MVLILIYVENFGGGVEFVLFNHLSKFTFSCCKLACCELIISSDPAASKYLRGLKWA